LIEDRFEKLSEEYAILARGSSVSYMILNKIIEAYAMELAEEVDNLVVEEYNRGNEPPKKVGDPKEWRHKQKKRPWN